MNFERVTHTDHPMYPSAMALYASSFPSHERREVPSQTAILRDPEYHFDLVYDGDSFVGLMLYWETESYIYIEHFCILPEARNNQYGRKTLAALKAKDKMLILEIDPPVDAISLRRKGFYERCGFVQNRYRHIHPPYHSGACGHELLLMTYPERIMEPQYHEFTQYLCHSVMHQAF